RVAFTNKSLARLYNINFTLQPETAVTKAVQATDNPGVTIFPDNDLGGIRIGEISVVVVDEKGIENSIPASTKSGFIAPRIKVQASELLGTGEMTIVMACVAINPSLHGE